MDNNSLLLSICIPTNGIVEWVVPVIDSIYAQGVDKSLFEVVITDNGDSTGLMEAVKKYKHENFYYYKTTSKGFTNQIDAFEKCNGLFCKMLNHRSKMLPGSIVDLLNLIKKYKDTKPILYCAEGNAKGGEFVECGNADEFVRSLSYYVSWSAGTGAWREDLLDIRSKQIDSSFPHTVFLFDLRKESQYVIWNKKYETMADDAGKGGYDLFDTFAVHFLDIIRGLYDDGRITCETFDVVRNDLFGFLTTLYKNEVILPTKHTFILKDIKHCVKVYYGTLGFWRMVFKAYLITPYDLFLSFVIKVHEFYSRHIIVSSGN